MRVVILISGATHTGKTALAQALLEKHKTPTLSLDHLKMGLIRSGETDISVEDDDALMPYIWKITREIIKTAVENAQSLIIEGVYIPFGWQKDFSDAYLADIKSVCLIMTRDYIEGNFEDIVKYASVAERRLDETYLTKELLTADNEKNLRLAREYGAPYILIDGRYDDEYIQTQLENIIKFPDGV